MYPKPKYKIQLDGCYTTTKKINTYQRPTRKIVMYCMIKLHMCEKQLHCPLILMLHIYVHVLTLMWQHHHC